MWSRGSVVGRRGWWWGLFDVRAYNVFLRPICSEHGAGVGGVLVGWGSMGGCGGRLQWDVWEEVVGQCLSHLVP